MSAESDRTTPARLRDARRPADVKTWLPDSAAASMWSRLNSLDFINQGMLFAGVLLLCFVPFMIVLQALLGRDGASGLIRRFGLDASATAAVRHALTSPSATTSSVTGISYVFLLLGGIAGATAIQELYERVFDEKTRGLKDLPRRLVWLVAMVGAGSLAGWIQPWLHGVGGPLLVGVGALLSATGFWWFSMWLLLSGRRRWGELLPAALATGVCWFGMTVVFRITLSDTITTDYKKYGDIGVVFAIMSLLIAMGVVLILGAVFGVVWRERHASVVAPQQSGDLGV